MAAPAPAHKAADKPREFKRPKDASDEAIVSDAGATEPTRVFGGDGVTPIDEFKEKYDAAKEKQAERDAERQEKALAEREVITTTASAK